MRRLGQQSFALAQRLPHQADLSVLQVTQPAVNDSGGAAGGAGGKIILLHQQRALAPLRTLARDGNTVDAAADDQNVKDLVLRLDIATHAYTYLDAFQGKDNVTSAHNIR
jgi:hypothetical protein